MNRLIPTFGLLLALPVAAGHGQAGLAKLGHARGAADAPVTVVEFGDFGCSACADFAGRGYEPIHREFVTTGRVRWVFVPFLLGPFPNSAEASRAAECAAEQEAFWPMHDLLFERQAQWKRPRNPLDLFRKYSDALGLEGSQFEACYRDGRAAARIKENTRAARKAGVRATPTFFINGRRFEGAPPPHQFMALLEMISARSAPGTPGEADRP